MNKKLCFSFFVLWALFVFSNGVAQTPEEYQKKYLYGKVLYAEGRYQAAAQVFLPLSIESPENGYSKAASFMFANSSFKGNDFEATKSMCLQMLQRYVEWDQRDEVYYLLGCSYFELSKFRLGVQFLGKVEGLKKDLESCKYYYVEKIAQIDTLKALQRDYPGEVVLATVLAKRLATGSSDERDKMLLNFLVQEYKLEIASLVNQKNTVLKKEYNIALLFPFQLNEIDPKVSKRSNQYILDFYEGAKIAVDSLKALGYTVNLYSYDTEKDATILPSILSLPEMKTMDLIVGPVFPAQVPLVTEFSKKNSILNISPFSANSKILENNEFTYLFQPTLEQQAGNAVRYASQNFRHDSSYVFNYTPPKHREKYKEPIEKKKVIIFYGNEVKDSLLAKFHKDSCLANKLEVIHMEKITRNKVGLLKSILGDTIKVGLCNHIFVATSDEVVAANIMSLMEISQQHTPLITKSDWLMFSLISFEQFEKRNVFFIHTDYFDYNNVRYRDFKTTYVNRTEIYPSLHSVQGYEIIMFFGTALQRYGTYFKYGLDQSGFIHGAIFQGFDFSNSFTNQYVPLTRFRDKNLLLVNVR